MHVSDLRRVDLNLLVALRALLQERSVTRAGERLGLSQPAMSRALGRLRDTFGDPLLIVAGRRLVPTERAEEIGALLGPILDNVQNLFKPPSFEPSSAKLTFKINAPEATTMLLLGDFVVEAAKLAPGMNFEFTSVVGGQLEALESGEIDLAVDTFIDAPEHFYKQSLLRDRLVCLVRHGHPTAEQRFTRWAFAEWPHIWIDTATSRALDGFLVEQGIERRIAVRGGSFLTAAAIVSRTNYILVLPSIVADRVQLEWPLVTLPIPWPVPVLSLTQLWHPRHHHNASHIWLRSAIKTSAGSLNKSTDDPD